MLFRWQLPELTYRPDHSLYQNPKDFLRRNRTHPEIQTEYQETLNSQNNFEKNNKAGRLTLTVFKTYYKAAVIKTM